MGRRCTRSQSVYTFPAAGGRGGRQGRQAGTFNQQSKAGKHAWSLAWEGNRLREDAKDAKDNKEKDNVVDAEVVDSKEDKEKRA